MRSPKRSKPKLLAPSLSEVNTQALSLESTLADLPLHQFQVESHYTGTEVAQIFEQYPTLPGVVLLEQGQLLGMISRQRLLEFLIRPRGISLVLPSALSILYSYAQIEHLILPASTSVLTAAQMALRRLCDQQNEPIVVQVEPQKYCLLAAQELNIAYWQIRGIETQVRYERAQLQMIQTEKMASLGRLVDGVAHEILDPVGFIWGNLTHLSTYTNQVMALLEAYEQQFPDLPPQITALRAEIELDYLRDDLPQTIASIRAGAERLKNLVTSLQNFCHVDDVYPKPADLHECLDSLLLLLKSRITGEIRIVKNYGHLPPISCYVGQLNQVFMNILTNAIDALLNQVVRQELAEEFRGQSAAWTKSDEQRQPQITITTQVRSAPSDISVASSASRWVLIQIADNGSGLSREKYQQIIDSFSVEKRSDKETSLALSYQIVTAKHGGRLYLRSHSADGMLSSDIASPDIASSGISIDLTDGSQSERGTEFEIWLPLT